MISLTMFSHAMPVVARKLSWASLHETGLTEQLLQSLVLFFLLAFVALSHVGSHLKSWIGKDETEASLLSWVLSPST